ncbi:MAG: helix-turn-helix transcriptional regulator [bacterium]
MATEAAQNIVFDDEGAAELTLLGKRLEILRIERGLSKQRLARHAGTSRQQLWRVMTGKSQLTTSLCGRLASALAVESAAITTGVSGVSQASVLTTSGIALTPALTPDAMMASDYLADARLVSATLRTLPAGDDGRRLKRALLNALEDLALETGRALPFEYSDIHRRVLAGEL